MISDNIDLRNYENVAARGVLCDSVENANQFYSRYFSAFCENDLKEAKWKFYKDTLYFK